MSTLTDRQQAIYEFIVHQVRREGIPPTLMEIAAAFGLNSAAGVADHLKAIERKGFIRRRPGASRGIELASAPRRTVAVPVRGRVPSDRGLRGRPEAEVFVDGRSLSGEALALRARVRGLEQFGILDGDLLIVEPDGKPSSGDLLVGRQGSRLLLLTAERGRQLRPLAGRFDARSDVSVLGRVTTVLRSMDRRI